MTRFSLIRSQGLSSVLLASLSRFVLTITGVSEAEITLDLQFVKGQNENDQIPPNLFGRLKSVLSLAERVADEIVGEETDIMGEIISPMFKVMQRVVECSCDYVGRGRLGKTSAFSRFRMC